MYDLIAVLTSYYTIILKFSALFILKFDPPFNFSRYTPDYNRLSLENVFNGLCV